MADNLVQRYAALDSNTSDPIRLKDIGGVLYAVSILCDSSGNEWDELPISAASLPLPSGASTSAKQDTGNAALAAIQTAVETLDNAIAGSEMQVDIISSALPSGAATLAEQQTQTTHLGRVAGKYVDFDTGGGTDSVVALGLLLPGNGGAVIGGTALSGGRGRVLGALVGALLMGSLNNGMSLMNVAPFFQDTARGVVLLLAVALDHLGRRSARSI